MLKSPNLKSRLGSPLYAGAMLRTNRFIQRLPQDYMCCQDGCVKSPMNVVDFWKGRGIVIEILIQEEDMVVQRG